MSPPAMRLRRVVLVALLGSVGCKGSFEIDVPGAGNASPYANAGTGGVFMVGSTVVLDGSESIDPDGTIGDYSWKLIDAPQGTAATITNASQAVAAIAPDVVGTWRVELTVTDDAGATAKSRTTIDVLGPKITVDAGADQAAPWRTAVSLSGSASVEQGFSLTSIGWTLLSKPPGSTAMLADAATLTPSFVPDREGTYLVELRANTSFNSARDLVMIEATVPRQFLDYGLVDAEYSTALDRFVIVGSSPPRLHLHDPVTGSESTVDLASPPTTVSLEPGGLRAAVGHNGSITIVDLQTLDVTTTFPLAIDVGDIVFGANNWVHCFGPSSIVTIDLASGVTGSYNTSGRLRRGRLHPDGLAMYVPTSGVSPDNFERFNVVTSPVEFVRRSPYHGTYRFGGDVWLTADGYTLVARSRNLFFSSTSSSVDMTYRGVLAGIGELNWAVHSPSAGRLATLGGEYNATFDLTDYSLREYDDEQFALARIVVLPKTPANNTSYLGEGRFAAYRSDGSQLYVITRADTGAGYVFVLYAI